MAGDRREEVRGHRHLTGRLRCLNTASGVWLHQLQQGQSPLSEPHTILGAEPDPSPPPGSRPHPDLPSCTSAREALQARWGRGRPSSRASGSLSLTAARFSGTNLKLALPATGRIHPGPTARFHPPRLPNSRPGLQPQHPPRPAVPTGSKSNPWQRQVPVGNKSNRRAVLRTHPKEAPDPRPGCRVGAAPRAGGAWGGAGGSGVRCRDWGLPPAGAGWARGPP